MGATVKLQIVPETGDLTCIPTVLHARPGQPIQFESDGLPFSILSNGLSPLNRVDIRSAGKPEDVSARVDAQPGVYSFACAVFCNGRIYMDAGCPSIIIDPGFRG